MKKYKLQNTHTKEIMSLTVTEILENINRDRSKEWEDYGNEDWREGLECFTEFILIKRRKPLAVGLEEGLK